MRKQPATSYVGIVKNGVVMLPPASDLAEGSEVTVEPIPSAAQPPSLYETLKPFIGIFKDLPADFAENHDHYLHGAPKRSRK